MRKILIKSSFLVATILLATIACKKEKSDPVKEISSPTLGSISAVGNTDTTSFEITSEITGDGGGKVTEYGHVYSESVNTPTLKENKTEYGAVSGAYPFRYTSKIEGLKPNTSYYIRPYATNSKGTTYGEVSQQKTRDVSGASKKIPQLNSVSSLGSITQTGFKINSELTGNGGATVSMHGHVFSETNKTPVFEMDSKTKLGAQAGPFPAKFASEVKDLKPATTYYVRPYATNEIGTAYGDVVQVTTTAPEISLAQFDAVSIKDDITNNTAKITSTLVSAGNGKISDHGHVWAEAKNPTIENGEESRLGARNGTLPAKYASELKNLKANTVYYVRPYAVNEKGTGYGQEIEIKTKENPTAPIISGLSEKGEVGENAITVTSTIESNGNAKITQHGHYYSKTNTKPNTSDGVIKLGEKTGTYPVKFSSQVNNLEESTTYYFRPFATNEKGSTLGDNAIQITTNGYGVWLPQGQYGALGGEVIGDYDGDGKTDIAKHEANSWFIDYARDGFGTWNEGPLKGSYSSTNTKPVPADYDGDGKTDIGIHDANGVWLIYYARGNWSGVIDSNRGYGTPGGEAVADYDGDGKDDIAIFKEEVWYIDYAKDGFKGWNFQLSYFEAGEKSVPVPADYDGDGKADIAVHFNDGRWVIDYAKNGYTSGAFWDEKLAGYGATGGENITDYDGDGKADIGLFQNGTWYIDYAKDGFGKWNKIKTVGNEKQGRAVSADYDGDGKADLGLHINDGRWLIDFWNNQK